MSNETQNGGATSATIEVEYRETFAALNHVQSALRALRRGDAKRGDLAGLLSVAYGIALGVAPKWDFSHVSLTLTALETENDHTSYAAEAADDLAFVEKCLAGRRAELFCRVIMEDDARRTQERAARASMNQGTLAALYVGADSVESTPEPTADKRQFAPLPETMDIVRQRAIEAADGGPLALSRREQIDGKVAKLDAESRRILLAMAEDKNAGPLSIRRIQDRLVGRRIHREDIKDRLILMQGELLVDTVTVRKAVKWTVGPQGFRVADVISEEN